MHRLCTEHSLKDHKRGTYYHPECTTKTNHCILAVGYGKDEKGEYYIIKNSWGEYFKKIYLLSLQKRSHLLIFV